MYKRKKMERYLRVNLLGRGPRLVKKNYRNAVKQRLRNTDVGFYSKNKFEKLVHLVGFIVRIYHDAQSSECRIHSFSTSALQIFPECQVC